MNVCAICRKDNGGMQTMQVNTPFWGTINLNICGHCAHKYGDGLPAYEAYVYGLSKEVYHGE